MAVHVLDVIRYEARSRIVQIYDTGIRSAVRFAYHFDHIRYESYPQTL